LASKAQETSNLSWAPGTLRQSSGLRELRCWMGSRRCAY